MKSSIALAAVFGILLVGIVIGALGIHLYHAHGHQRPEAADLHSFAERLHPDAHSAFIEHLETVLELTFEQKASVDEILEESHRESQAMRKELGPRIRAHMQATHRRLLELLNPEQQEKLNELHRLHRSSAERFLLGHPHPEASHPSPEADAPGSED